MPEHGPQALKGIKALTFDVFGTVVDWRRPVEAALSTALRSNPRPYSASSPSTEDEAAERAEAEARARALTDADIAALAQQWRDSYKYFTRGFRPGVDPWKGKQLPDTLFNPLESMNHPFVVRTSRVF